MLRIRELCWGVFPWTNKLFTSASVMIEFLIDLSDGCFSPPQNYRKCERDDSASSPVRSTVWVREELSCASKASRNALAPVFIQPDGSSVHSVITNESVSRSRRFKVMLLSRHSSNLNTLGLLFSANEAWRFACMRWKHFHPWLGLNCVSALSLSMVAMYLLLNSLFWILKLDPLPSL